MSNEMESAGRQNRNRSKGGRGEAAKETLSLSDWKHMCVSTEREWEREGATKSDGTKFKGKLVLSFCSRCPRGGGFPRLFSWLSSTN